MCLSCIAQFGFHHLHEERLFPCESLIEASQRDRIEKIVALFSTLMTFFS